MAVCACDGDALRRGDEGIEGDGDRDAGERVERTTGERGMGERDEGSRWVTRPRGREKQKGFVD